MLPRVQNESFTSAIMASESTNAPTDPNPALSTRFASISMSIASPTVVDPSPAFSTRSVSVLSTSSNSSAESPFTGHTTDSPSSSSNDSPCQNPFFSPPNLGAGRRLLTSKALPLYTPAERKHFSQHSIITAQQRANSLSLELLEKTAPPKPDIAKIRSQLLSANGDTEYFEETVRKYTTKPKLLFNTPRDYIIAFDHRMSKVKLLSAEPESHGPDGIDFILRHNARYDQELDEKILRIIDHFCDNL